MGSKKADRPMSSEYLREFEIALLNDLRALETMLHDHKIESDIQRIGAEQELFIVDHAFRPAPVALKLLKLLNDPHYRTELAKFNLEFNLDPIIFKDICFTELEKQIQTLFDRAQEAARELGYQLILVGILPTVHKADLTLENMTPNPRYRALDQALTRFRGKDYILFLRGTDELFVKHDSVMLEAGNTSFQVHFQVAQDQFARYYNIAQAVAGPVLAAAANSPLLFGKRLWHETRIAVFQQSVDTRLPFHALREITPRVSFGNKWVRESVLEIYQEDIARFKVLIGTKIEEDPFEILQRGGTPQLQALQLFNGTVYRWNRPCYGVTDGKPHLRIENRILPAGPTILDQVANAAFWFGLVNGLAEEYEDITAHFSFDEAKTNFINAARRGLQSQLTWIRSKAQPAQKLIRNRLLPLAREGLSAKGIDAGDIDRLMDVIKRRVTTGQTGAFWMLQNYTRLKNRYSIDESLAALTATISDLQQRGTPVAEWPRAQLQKGNNWAANFRYVDQIMTTDVYTVTEDDSIELVVSLMNWQGLRNIPVEDHQNRFVGLVDYQSLLHHLLGRLLNNHRGHSASPVPVRNIMKKNVPTVRPRTASYEALKLMREKGVNCLPVVQEGRLVGIVTIFDFMKISEKLIKEKLKS